MMRNRITEDGHHQTTVLVILLQIMVDSLEVMVDSPQVILHISIPPLVISRGGIKMTLVLTLTDFSQAWQLRRGTVLLCEPGVHLNLFFHRIWNLVHPMVCKDPEALEDHIQYVPLCVLLF